MCSLENYTNDVALSKFEFPPVSYLEHYDNSDYKVEIFHPHFCEISGWGDALVL